MKMKRIYMLPVSKQWTESSRLDFARRDDGSSEIRFDKRVNRYALLWATAALVLVSGYAFGQTTRTNPSAASTSPSIPASSSTSPNSPCNPANPSSPCYSAKSPRNPCYSATNDPCSTTTTLTSRPSAAPPPKAATTVQAAVPAITEDQAKSQMEAKGYSNVTGLRKDAKGIWSGKAVKDGIPVNVTLDLSGNVTAN
jgi:hypothetical protein